MKKMYTFILAASLIVAFNQTMAQTIWTGPNITFTKAGGADWTLEENQDRLTDSVWITRANNKGLFNIAKEAEFDGDGGMDFGPSPSDTEWAYGSTSDGIDNLTFSTWTIASTIPDSMGFANPPLMVDSNMVVHLISEDIYLNIKMLSWGSGQEGMGSFSYERASDVTTDVYEIDLDQNKSLTVFPNPAGDYLIIQDLKDAQDVEILNTLGVSVYKNNINPNDQIDTSLLPAGVYYIQTENGRSTSFIKQ